MKTWTVIFTETTSGLLKINQPVEFGGFVIGKAHYKALRRWGFPDSVMQPDFAKFADGSVVEIHKYRTYFLTKIKAYTHGDAYNKAEFKFWQTVDALNGLVGGMLVGELGAGLSRPAAIISGSQAGGFTSYTSSVKRAIEFFKDHTVARYITSEIKLGVLARRKEFKVLDTALQGGSRLPRNSVPSRVANACNWLGRALKTNERHISFLKAAVALEVLLSVGGDVHEGRISDSIATRAAFLVGSAGNRYQVYRKIKKLYGVRSKIVHEGARARDISTTEIRDMITIAKDSIVGLARMVPGVSTIDQFAGLIKRRRFQ